MHRWFLGSLALVLLFGSLHDSRAQTHAFTIRDMLAMERISSHQVSPDGKSIVFVVRTTDLAANRGRTDLWLVGTDGNGLRRLTTHPASDSNPRWAPDGESIWFLSTRSDSSQVWSIGVNGGEAQQVTHLPLDAGNLVVSPDGERLAFTLAVFPDCNDLSCTTERLAEREADPTSGVVFERLFIRHWDTWKDGRRSHLFVTPSDGSSDPVDTMTGMDADTPSKPFGGPGEITFTPDSRSLVFTARDAGREEAWSTNFDLHVVPADGSSPARLLTESNRAWGHESGVFAGWPNARLPGDVESWLRSGSLPRGAPFLARRRRAHTNRRLGSLTELNHLVRGWRDSPTRLLRTWARTPSSQSM